jgi:Bacterial Ig domain
VLLCLPDPNPCPYPPKLHCWGILAVPPFEPQQEPPVLRSIAPRLIAVLPLLALPATAVAAEPSVRPATWDMSVDELRAVGLGQTRAAPIPMPATPEKQGDVEPKTAKQGVVFVSFDAITVTMGFDDSKTNMSSIFGQEFAAFGGADADRAAVMEAVRADWAPYDVLFVDERPAAGDYTMNITSPTNPFGSGSGVLGIAPLDCNDAMVNNITYAFHGAGDGFGPITAATTIGQEVAHSFGLEHVDDPTDIMNPVNSGGDPTFKDECLPIVQGGMCAAQHMAHCGSATSQNSHQELLELFGSSIPDTQAPLVVITAPSDGDTFEVGAAFRIDVTVTDDNAVATVQLFDGDAALQVDTSEPYGWDVVDIPEGVYEFTVKASDPSGNETVSDLVTVYVGVDPPMVVDTDTDSGTGGIGEDGDGGGCGCRQSGPRGWGALGFGMLVLGATRRRSGAA